MRESRRGTRVAPPAVMQQDSSAPFQQHAAYPSPGQSVLVRWSTGDEYPAQVVDVRGDQILCRFQNGSENWVPSPYVRPAAAQPVGPAPIPAPATTVERSKKPSRAALLVAAVVVVLGFLGMGTFVLVRLLSPKDAAFAEYAREASESMLNATLSKPHDARWNGTNPLTDLRGTSAEEKRILASLGGTPQIKLVTVDIGAVKANGAGHLRLGGDAVILRTGEVRWLHVERADYSFPETAPVNGIEQAEPVLAAAVGRLVAEASGACEFPAVTSGDVSGFPATLQEDILKHTSAIPRACVSGGTVDGWEPRAKGLIAVVESNGRWALLRSKFLVDGGKLYLGPVSVKLVSESGVAQGSVPSVPSAAPAPARPSAGAVSLGDKVQVPHFDGSGSSQGTVAELYGKLAQIQFGANTRDWAYLTKLTPAGTPLADPVGDRCSVLIGQRVKVKWPFENKKYQARVGEVYGKMARVAHQSDGTLQWAPCEDLEPVF